MNTRARSSIAEHLGHWLGCGWRAYARGEQRASAWLVSQGVPAAGVAIALWIVKIGILAGLFYIASWLVLLLLVGAVYVWFQATNLHDDDRWSKSEELRNGEAGFGLYASNGQRIDPHDPNDPFD
jgi:fatty acid desaturase